MLDDKKACNLCGSIEHTIVIDGRYGKIVKCCQCGLMFRLTSIGPHPVEQSGGAERHARQYETKQKVQLVDYEKCLPIIEGYRGNSNRDLLEIGSHKGHFLDIARSRGWRVKGIEPAEVHARRAIEDFGLDVAINYLRDTKLPEESYDVVVMFHVIEHFLDPLAELIEINRILRQGGILVAETPRFDTIWFKVLRERERSVIPGHYFYFTRESLTQMIAKAGFSILRLDSVGRTLTLDRLVSNIAKVIDSKNVSHYLVRISDALHFNRLKIHVNLHDMMRIYARKE